MDHYIERVVDLLDPSLDRIYNMSVAEARQRVLSGKPEAVRDIDGSFALLAREGKTIRMARSLDRPMRYFLAKRQEGPALIVADRIDTLYNQLKSEGLDGQFHPSYTRMVPAHHITEIQLVGCPDPDPTYTRYFTPRRNALPADLDEIGRRYIGALADEIAKWLQRIEHEEGQASCLPVSADIISEQASSGSLSQHLVSVRSAAVLGSSNVSTPYTAELHQVSPAPNRTAPETGALREPELANSA